MAAVTTRNAAKAWSWSYSKLKNFEVCPKRHYNIDIAKTIVEEESEQLAYGNKLHDALAKRIAFGTELPLPYREHEQWALKVIQGPGKKLVEQKLAINENLEPVSWFDKKAWFRGIADVVSIHGPVAAALDWKTGKIVEDSVQLALVAQCIFSHHPDIQAIRCEFVWLKEDATTREDFRRQDMAGLWSNVLPRIALMKQANETETYPATPNRLCKRWCPVHFCPHHGK
jgi:hypothetical protein